VASLYQQCPSGDDSPSDKTQDRGNEEDSTEATEDIRDPSAYQHHPGHVDSLEENIGPMGSHLIRSILLQSPRCNFRIQSDLLADIESLQSLVTSQEMPFKIGYLSDVMLFDGRGGALLRLCDVDRQGPKQSVHGLNCSRRPA